MLQNISIFVQRDIRQMAGDAKIAILPMVYFGISFFLLRFILSDDNYGIGLFWVLFTLSTMGAFGQTVAVDNRSGMLQALMSDIKNMYPYLISKGLCLTIVWAVPFWLWHSAIGIMYGADINFVASFVAIAITSFALAHLYILLDCIYISGQNNSILGVVFTVPFLLPILIFSITYLEKSDPMILLVLISYSAFLSLGSLILSNKTLKFSK